MASKKFKNKRHLIPQSISLREEGWTLQQIADELGVSDSCVHRWLDPKAREKHNKQQRETRNSKISQSSETYFIADLTRGKVKIGTTKVLDIRLSTLQIGNPEELTLMGSCQLDEQEIHEAFEDEHCRGEWFELSPCLSEFIGAVTHG